MAFRLERNRQALRASKGLAGIQYGVGHMFPAFKIKNLAVIHIVNAAGRIQGKAGAALFFQA